MDAEIDLTPDTHCAEIPADNPLEPLAIGTIVALKMYVCEEGHLHVPRKPPPCVAKKDSPRIILP